MSTAGVPDRRPIFWAAACFYLLLASNYILRPLRDALGLVGKTRDLPWLFLATLAGTLLVFLVFSSLVARTTRRRLLPLVYRFCALSQLLFAAGLHRWPADVALARLFFVWTSVFNLLLVAVFWGLLADVFRREEGERWFGLVGAGGTIGALSGSLVTAGLAERLGPAVLLCSTAVLLELTVFGAHRLCALRPDPVADTTPAGRPSFGWARELFAAPYLRTLALYMLCMTLTTTLVYFEQARIVKAALSSTAARTALFARIDLLVNLVGLVGQTLLAATIIRHVGVGLTLCALPLLTAVGLFGLRGVPTLALLVPLQIARRAVEYALTRPAREVLFTVVAREQKYRAKSFIDTFVYRAGDALGAGLYGVLPVAGIAWAAAPLCLVSVVAALYLGRRAVAS